MDIKKILKRIKENLKNKLNLKNDLWINLLVLNKKQQKNLDEHIKYKQNFHKIELEEFFFLMNKR